MKNNKTTLILIIATSILGLVAIISAIRLSQIKTSVSPVSPDKSSASTNISCQALTFTITQNPTPTPTENPLLALIGDFVWNDTNKNGIQDNGEQGISNVTVKLYDSTNSLINTTITNSQGIYEFNNLAAGNYIVEFVKPSGYLFSPINATNDTKDSDANTSTGKTATITLSAGETDTTIDAGLYKSLGSIGDFVWEDTNKNGIQDNGEPAVANVTVQLFLGSTLVDSMTTDSNGKYLFTNLEAGNYQVVFSLPAGYSYTQSHLGTNGALDSDVNNIGHANVTLTAGQNDIDTDMGIIIGAAKIGDKVWNDTNKNGLQDSGEVGVADITVRLYAGTGSTISSTTTNSQGLYLFDNLVPGNYSVEFILPSGYAFTNQNQGTDDTKDSDVDTTTGKTNQTSLTAFEEDMTWDAGIYSSPTQAALGDRVWKDTNDNGIQDTTEDGVASVTVRLLNSNGVQISQTSTDSQGYYGFANLNPGSYIVEFVKPSGYKFTKMDQGSDNSKDSDADVTSGKTTIVTLSAGQSDYTWDAGLSVDGTGGSTPTPTPTATPTATATSTSKSTSTSSSRPTATATSTLIASKTPAPSATAASLPSAGVGTPTIIGSAIGAVLLISAVVLLGIF